jgi:hypothetical protein
MHRAARAERGSSHDRERIASAWKPAAVGALQQPIDRIDERDDDRETNDEPQVRAAARMRRRSVGSVAESGWKRRPVALERLGQRKTGARERERCHANESAQRWPHALGTIDAHLALIDRRIPRLRASALHRITITSIRYRA